MREPERRWVLIWAVIIVGLTCVPYLAACQLAPGDTAYTGLLINQYDGESYYAKMQQGARGDWLFHLAFTPEPHDGAFIFTFYLALGHLSALVGLPLPLSYHLARAAAGLLLLIVAYGFIARCLEAARARKAAFLLLGLSAGLGWLMAPLGMMTADLWVVEGFTFLTILANPHFPLAIALMLAIMIQVLDATRENGESAPTGERIGDGSGGATRRSGAARLAGRVAACTALGLLLAVIQPFAVPVTLVVLAVYLAFRTGQARRLPWREVLLTGAAAAGAAPVMIYDLYVYQANPALAAWSAQNLTPSLAPWDYALGYGLVLILAAAGIPAALRRRQPGDMLVVAWAVSAAVLLYVPFALQRRFITGLHVPLVVLAALGLQYAVWPRIQARRRALATGLFVAASALTNVLVPAAAVGGVARGEPPLVMSADEAAAWGWLKANTAWTDTVLAPVASGQFVPAWAGNRVVYGHPFETIEAEAKRAEVERFFSSATPEEERLGLLKRYGVRYVFVPDPAALGDLAGALGLSPVWAGSRATLYKVQAGP